jgi:amidase
MKRFMAGGLAALLAGAVPVLAQAQSPAPAAGPYASAARQQAAMSAGAVTSEQLVRDALARIMAMDHAGPRLNAVLAVAPDAADQAWALDAERKAGHVRGPLHGLPILLKDNIETGGALATTAGSLALKDNVAEHDAPIARRLRQAGAVILGKANLSEWANFRSSHSVSGWSPIGGLTRNPYGLDRTACGSSSGSAVAVAAGYVAAAIGTETDGSITCPAAMNGVVGFKPTVGLVSRSRIVPISPEQDTAGPIARTVLDAAMVLTAIAGSDPADPATKDADAHRADFAAALDAQSLKGARIGVFRHVVAGSPQTDTLFDQALDRLRGAGVILIEVDQPPQAKLDALDAAETTALQGEFKAAIDAYLASTPPQVTARDLNGLIAFDAATPAETTLFGQDTFEAAAKVTPEATAQARATARRLAGMEGLDPLFSLAELDAIVAPSNGPAGVTDPVDGTRDLGSPTSLPAVAGYPHLTVPMGRVDGLPVGLSFIGRPWTDARILSLGYAFEQLSPAFTPPAFPASVAAEPAIGRAFDPR